MNKNKDYNECCGAVPAKTSYIDMFKSVYNFRKIIRVDSFHDSVIL